MELEAAITSRLKTNITALSNRVYPIAAEQNAPLPYATYQRISTVRNPTLTEQGTYDIAIQFNVYAKTYSQVKTLMDSVRGCFEDHIGVYITGAPYVQRTTITNEFDGYNTDTQEYEGIIEISFLM